VRGSSGLELGGQTTKVVSGVRSPTTAGGTSETSSVGRPGDRGKEETSLGTRALNAVASVSIVVLALLIFVIWRNGGRVDLRDPATAFLAAFGVHRPVPASQSLPASIYGSGLYRSASGLPLLFVRGRVQNLTHRAQRVRVRLTVEDSGRVAAESEAWPSSLPTPVELYGVRSAADLKALQRIWDEREPPPLGPLGEADFMLVTADLPTSLGSLLLKVTAVPQADGTESTQQRAPTAPHAARRDFEAMRPPTVEAPARDAHAGSEQNAGAAIAKGAPSGAPPANPVAP
jgi:hypothetical protein